jgi:hypothetical protein
MKKLTAIVLAVFAVQPSVASGAELVSEYTRLDQDVDCTVIERAAEGEGEWADLVCPGIAGYPYVIRYGDGRETVTYGFTGENAMTSFAPFNYSNGTVEWRMRTEGDAKRPVAAIQRWFLADIDGNWATQILVVSKVAQPEPDPEACVVGYVSAADGAPANVRARLLADAAESFVCGSDSVTVEPAIAEFVSAQ